MQDETMKLKEDFRALLARQKSRELTPEGKLNRRLWNDACFMGRVGHPSYGGLDVLVTAQPRAGR